MLNTMVAICDILGFSTLVLEHDANTVVEKVLSFFRKALYYSIHKEAMPAEAPSFNDLVNQERIGFAWFSDTVLFHSLKDDDEDCKAVIETVAWLLFSTIFTGFSRIRAGIAYGEMHIDAENRIYVGAPLIEAFRVEQDQEWSGACLSESAEKRIPDWVLNEGGYFWYLTKYPVPLKSQRGKKPKRQLAVDWTRGIHSPQPFPWSKHRAEPSPEELQTKSDIIQKWRNTKVFHDTVCDYCKNVLLSEKESDKAGGLPS